MAAPLTTALAKLPMPSRRHCLRLGASALALGLLGATSGCGFQLRGQHAMAFQTIQLTGFAGNSPLAAELARALEASGVRVVGSTLEAVQAASSASVPSGHIVFEAVRDSRDLVVASTTSYGQIRDMTARTTLRFQIRRGDGTLLLPLSDLTLSRDLTYNEKDALAKQDESAALHRAMQTDIVGQVLRRLAAIRPDQLTTPAPAPSGIVDGRVPSPVRPPASSAD